MDDAKNIDRAWAWLEHYLSFPTPIPWEAREAVLLACARALAAAVRAKGEDIGMELDIQGDTPKWIVGEVHARAADMPEVP